MGDVDGNRQVEVGVAMRVLQFDVNRQEIRGAAHCDFTGIVQGTEGYLSASFLCSGEWAACKKVAVFYCLGQEYPVPVIGNTCEIPKEALVWKYFSVSLIGDCSDYRITTNKCRVDQEER